MKFRNTYRFVILGKSLASSPVFSEAQPPVPVDIFTWNRTVKNILGLKVIRHLKNIILDFTIFKDFLSSISFYYYMYNKFKISPLN